MVVVEIGISIKNRPSFNRQPISIYFDRNVRPAEIMNRHLHSEGRLLRLDFSFKLWGIVKGSNQVSILFALYGDRFRAYDDDTAPKPVRL